MFSASHVVVGREPICVRLEAVLSFSCNVYHRAAYKIRHGVVEIACNGVVEDTRSGSLEC